MAVGEPVMSELDESSPFSAPNLEIHNSDTYADLEWDHAACIGGYAVTVCPEGDAQSEDCVTDEITPEGGAKSVRHRVEGLQPCTLYSLEVVPSMPGKTFTARSNDFTTTNGTPQVGYLNTFW